MLSNCSFNNVHCDEPSACQFLFHKFLCCGTYVEETDSLKMDSLCKSQKDKRHQKFITKENSDSSFYTAQSYFDLESSMSHYDVLTSEAFLFQDKTHFVSHYPQFFSINFFRDVFNFFITHYFEFDLKKPNN
jgi:hypothetical protein